jgi:hypothetical protein
VPPLPGAVIVVTAPGVDTVSDRVPCACDVAAADGLAEALPAEDVPPVPAGVAATALNVAEPSGVAAVPELAGTVCAGTAIAEIRVAAEPGAAGGQDLVIDVTAAR